MVQSLFRQNLMRVVSGSACALHAHEDWRYVDMRKQSGAGYWLVSLVALHYIPTGQVLLGMLGPYAGLTHGSTATVPDYIALGTTLVAVLLELVADEQLRQHVAAAQAGRRSHRSVVFLCR